MQKIASGIPPDLFMSGGHRISLYFLCNKINTLHLCPFICVCSGKHKVNYLFWVMSPGLEWRILQHSEQLPKKCLGITWGNFSCIFFSFCMIWSIFCPEFLLPVSPAPLWSHFVQVLEHYFSDRQKNRQTEY